MKINLKIFVALSAVFRIIIFMETNKTYRNEANGNWAKIVPMDKGYKIIRGFKDELIAQEYYIEITKTKRAAIVCATKWIGE